MMCWTSSPARPTPKAQTTTLAYDSLGRMLQRIEPDLTSTWTYDAGAKGIGKLATTSTNGGYSRAHTYDALGRPDQTQLTIDGATYAFTTSYDAVSGVSYPSGLTVAYGYNATGYQTQLTNVATGEVYWTANARDAELRLIQQTAGNGVATSKTFAPLTGERRACCGCWYWATPTRLDTRFARTQPIARSSNVSSRLKE